MHGNDLVDMLYAVVEGLKMSDAFGKSLFRGKPLCHMLYAGDYVEKFVRSWKDNNLLSRWT